MVDVGMDVARINCSHGNCEIHKKFIHLIRSVSEETHKHIGIMLDIRGPKVRIGNFKNGPVVLKEDQTFILSTRNHEGDGKSVFVRYPHLTDNIKPGMTIYIDDGLIYLKVLSVTDTDVVCRVIVGGQLNSNKGVTLPGVPIKLPALTEKDKEDIRLGMNLGVDFIAASFVRKAADIKACREIISQSESESSVKIIAKIESREGIDNLEEIIKEADSVMIARGDLGVEIPAEDVPIIQKMIINKCNEAGIPVITATQMLDSMIRNANPTRAEVTDVANAIFDGTDSIMLSGETAIGKYPLDSVKTMAKIAIRAEDSLNYKEMLKQTKIGEKVTIADAISHATCQTAQDLRARAIISATQSGYTAKMVSKYRPQAPIIAASPDIKVARQLSLWWGVYPILVKHTDSTDEMLDVVTVGSKTAGFVKEGDLLVITGGIRTGIPGSTNLLQVQTL